MLVNIPSRNSTWCISWSCRFFSSIIQARPPNGIVKGLKWYKTNVMVVGYDNLNAFPAVWRPQISIFSGGTRMPPDLPKTVAEYPTVPNYAGCPDSSWESWIPTRLQSGHGEYTDFKDQRSQANEQRNIYFLNYHIICHKMNKPLTWISARWIPSCSHVEWRKNYKITAHNNAGMFDRKAF